jgi:hypothetical protein
MALSRRRTIFVVAIAAAFIGPFALLQWLPARRVQQRLAAVQSAGLPISARELDAWYANVPARQNRAFAILEAGQYLSPMPPALDRALPRLHGPRAAIDLPASLSQAIEDHVKSNRPALSRLHEAAELSQARYPINLAAGFSTRLPHFEAINSLSLLLQAEALHHLLIGDRPAAARSVRSGFAVAESLQNEPILISEVVRLNCVARAVNALEWLANEVPLDPGQLDVFAALLQQAERAGASGLERALIGERAISIEGFRMPWNQIERVLAPDRQVDSSWHLLLQMSSRATGMRRHDLKKYLQLTERQIAISRLDWPEALAQSADLDRETAKLFDTGYGKASLTRLFYVPLSDILRDEALLAGRLRCAMTALAVERHRLGANGQPPESLADLAPENLPQLVDPFHGKPLDYRRLPGGGYRISFAAPERQTVPPNASLPRSNFRFDAPADTSFTVSR